VIADGNNGGSHEGTQEHAREHSPLPGIHLQEKDRLSVVGLKSEGRRSTMKVMLVGDPGEQRTQLKTVLAALAEPELEIVEGETVTAANLSENVEAPPDATLVMVNGNEEAALSFLESQSVHSPHPSLLAVLSAR
jgi:hypothetical protein